MRITGVSEHLDDDVLDTAYVMLGLTALRLGGLETHETITELFLDGKVIIARNGCDKINQVVLRHVPSPYA